MQGKRRIVSSRIGPLPPLQLLCLPVRLHNRSASCLWFVMPAVSQTGMCYVCRQYRVDIAAKVVTFLSAVKASLVKLGVDANRLTRITAEVTMLHC